MPREQKKRGRRLKEKLNHEEDHSTLSAKRQKIHHSRGATSSDDLVVTGDAGDDYIGFGFDDEGLEGSNPQQQFYGLLDEDEQQYYANVNRKINANDFESDEDLKLFIEAVHRESKGKEIKIASSQSCSRYLEKVIQLSTVTQLKSIFTAFLEDLNYLVQHRFGSHCCETLFLHGANQILEDEGGVEGEASLESLYLKAAKELTPNIGYLLTERFASHTIRVLLLVLSGEPLDDASLQRVLASRKKEGTERFQEVERALDAQRNVPQSFEKAMKSLIDAAVSGLDTTYLRALATHPTGNPVLQLLLRLELENSNTSQIKSEGALFKKIFPDNDFDPESESSKFLSGLVYDPTGSHLVETIVKHLPGKTWKRLYKAFFKERLGRLAKNDVAGYVAVRILERISKDDLLDAHEQILREVPGLIERRRFTVVRMLIERCEVRQVDTTSLASAIDDALGNSSDRTLAMLLQLDAVCESRIAVDKHSAENEKSTTNQNPDLQGSLLAQAMLRSRPTSKIIQDGILSRSASSLISLANNPISSRILQVALTSTVSPTKFKRELIPIFYGRIAELAVNPCGSHVVDALWEATNPFHFMKERIAGDLMQDESTIRESLYGRTVWRNWAMDIYKSKPREWHAKAKGFNAEAHANEEEVSASKKSAIQLARERHMQKQHQKPGSGLRQQDRNKMQPVPANA